MENPLFGAPGWVHSGSLISFAERKEREGEREERSNRMCISVYFVSVCVCVNLTALKFYCRLLLQIQVCTIGNTSSACKLYGERERDERERRERERERERERGSEGLPPDREK